jgi:hypothetical protein
MQTTDSDNLRSEKEEAFVQALDSAMINAQVFSQNMLTLYQTPQLKHFGPFRGHLGMMHQGSGWFAETTGNKLAELGRPPMSEALNRLRADMRLCEPIADFNTAARHVVRDLTDLLRYIKTLKEAAQAAGDDDFLQLTAQSLRIVAGNIWAVQSMRYATLN